MLFRRFTMMINFFVFVFRKSIPIRETFSPIVSTKTWHKDHLMMPYYYQGSVYRDMNDAPHPSRRNAIFAHFIEEFQPILFVQSEMYKKCTDIYILYQFYSLFLPTTNKNNRLWKHLNFTVSGLYWPLRVYSHLATMMMKATPYQWRKCMMC